MEMKKILTVMVAGSLVFACAACSKDENKDVLVNQDGTNTPIVNEEKPNLETPSVENNEPALTPEENVENKAEKPEQKPVEKPVEKPEQKPVEKPVEKPAEKVEPSVPEVPVEPVAPEQPSVPEEPKQEETTSDSVGNVLLKDFKEKAGSASSVLELAEDLVANPVIQFMGGAMEVEEGFLSGFDNAEITGFKSGVTFAPMISTIPFLGYIFELDDSVDVDTFKSSLEENANLRWNICTEAEELIVENVGNKVFFLMCPKSFDEPAQ